MEDITTSFLTTKEEEKEKSYALLDNLATRQQQED